MAEEDSMSVGPTGAPVNRDQKRDPGVIEGDAIRAEAETEAAAAAAEQPVRAEPAPPPRFDPPPPPPRPSRFGAFLAGAVGGAVVAALAIAGYSSFGPKAGLSDEDASRIAAVESAAQKENAAVGAVEKRLAGLDAASAALAAKVAAATQSADQAAAAAKNLGATPANSGLAQRIEKLEIGRRSRGADGRPGAACGADRQAGTGAHGG